MSVRNPLRSRGPLRAPAVIGPRGLASTGGGTFPLGVEALDGGRGLDAGRSLAGGRAATLGALGLLGLLAAALVVALAAPQTDTLLPESVRPIPSWLAGPFGGAGLDIGYWGVIATLTVMLGAYGLVLRHTAGLSGRAVLAAIAGVHALVLLAPPLISTDLFSYQAYARMGAIYGANPYVLGPHAIALDPLYPFIGAKWVTIPTAYGPLFTILSYPLAALDIAASAVAYKALAALASLVAVAGLWNAASARGLDPVRAVALYGLNPLVVVYGVGGGHNDLLMVALLVVGVLMLLSGRERSGAGGLVAAAGIKLTAVVVLPFALAGQAGRLRERRRRLLVGGGTMLLALGAVSYALFGIGSLHLLSTIHRSQSLGDWHSIPGFVASRFGGSGRIGQLAGLSLDVAFVAGLGVLLRRVLRGELDWVAAAGWATVLMLVTATSLLPWYVAWLLPLAALGGDRRLYRWAFGLTVLVQAINLLGYLPHGSALLGL